MVQMVSHFLGDHLLMFSTDYPHPETRFPVPVDLVWSWSLATDPVKTCGQFHGCRYDFRAARAPSLASSTSP